MGRERGKEGKKHQCVVASRATPTGDLARNPGMCPDWESNRRPFGLQEDNSIHWATPARTWLKFLIAPFCTHARPLMSEQNKVDYHPMVTKDCPHHNIPVLWEISSQISPKIPSWKVVVTLPNYQVLSLIPSYVSLFLGDYSSPSGGFLIMYSI